MDEEERALAAKLSPGETVVARGRMHEADSARIAAEASKYDFMLVTSERILWTHGKWNSSLEFDSVRAWGEGQFSGHRYALILRHLPFERVQWVPAHRVLWWSWGNAEAVRTRASTTFGFSRRDTMAAEAIRERLRRREIPAAVAVAPADRSPARSSNRILSLRETSRYRTPGGLFRRGHR